MKSDKVNISEYLSKDILEENFVNIFSYIYRLQFFLGSSRVVAKNRFVTPPTNLQKCYTILCNTLTIGSIFISIQNFFEVVAFKSVRTLGVSCILCIFAASLCNVVHVRFFNGRQNVEFHVTMQKLDRLMKIEKHKTINSDLQRINAVSVFLLLMVLVTLIVLASAGQQFNWSAFIFLLFCVLPFILELIVCSGIVVYFLDRVRFVNFLIGSYLKQEENVRTPIALDQSSFKWIKFVTLDSDIEDFTTSKVHIYLKEIFRCFMIFQDLYKFQLLLFCLKLVVLSLITFELVFYTLMQSIFDITEVSGYIMFEIIDVIIAVCLAIRFEVFHSEVKKTKRLCINVMALHQDGHLREKARCMLKMIEEAPPRFTVYDMWEMNAGMFVTIFSLVTGLIVTLIQFTIM